MAAGSENNSVYVYYKGFSNYLLTYKFDTLRSLMVIICVTVKMTIHICVLL